MRFGKIRVENGEVKFSKMMKSCLIPCKDIRWAYYVTDSREETKDASVLILTKMQKRYQFEMTLEEACSCISCLKENHEDLIVGCPKGNPLPLKSVFNTRDLGGMTANDGRMILPGQLIRSGELYHLSAEDAVILQEEYHLATVLDFRTEEEQRQKPDTVIDGVTYVKNPIFEESMLGITREMSPMDMLMQLGDNPDAYMMSLYQKIVLDRNSQYYYARFFQHLIDNEEGHAILWHCSVGKDRVGIGTMLLLYALGVPRGEIMDDYMRTNTCQSKELEYLCRLMESQNVPDSAIQKMRAVMSAKECYLQSAISTIESEYGSMEHYLRCAMCLTAANLTKLKKRYLV